MKKRLLYILGLVSLILVSCTQDFDNLDNTSGGKLPVSIALANYMVDGGVENLPGENEISEIRACLFLDGVLSSVYEPSLGNDGNFRLDVDKTEGNLYVVANGMQYGIWTDMKVGETRESEWLSFITGVSDNPGMYFTGMSDLRNVADRHLNLTLKRGLARIDIQGLSENMRLKEATISGIADKAYFFSQEIITVPETSVGTDRVFSFTEPLVQDKKGLAYLHEQPCTSLNLSLKLDVNGVEKTVTSSFNDIKEIKRNAVYTLQLAESGEIIVNVKVDEWGQGDDAVIAPEFQSDIKINSVESELYGAEVVDNGRGLLFPHYESEVVISLSCSSELELVSVNNEIVSAEPFIDETGVPVRNKFKIRKKLQPIGVSSSPSNKLYFKRKGMNDSYQEDYITYSSKENPGKLTGKLSFDIADASCRFDTYIDNELGIFEVEEGREVVVSIDNDEDPWVIVKQAEGNPLQYRVVAGWKPNDPKADGRVQEAKIIIRDKNVGNVRSVNRNEVYTVSRKNYGLPVTYLNDNWWCKYNALGTSNDFTDQILVTQDPSVKNNQTVQDYLKSCPGDVAFRIWNSSYMGDSGESMPLIYDGSKFTLKGYNAGETLHINSVDKYKLAPNGYEMPTYEDYSSVFYSGSVPTYWAAFNPANGGQAKRCEIIREVRSGLMLDDKTLPDVHLVSIRSINNRNEILTFYSLGCQWNNNGMNYKWIIPACYKTSDYSNAWAMTNGGGLESWRPVGANNTRTIRFKKSPVEYMYGAEDLPNPWK